MASSFACSILRFVLFVASAASSPPEQYLQQQHHPEQTNGSPEEAALSEHAFKEVLAEAETNSFEGMLEWYGAAASGVAGCQAIRKGEDLILTVDDCKHWSTWRSDACGHITQWDSPGGWSDYWDGPATGDNVRNGLENQLFWLPNPGTEVPCHLGELFTLDPYPPTWPSGDDASYPPYSPDPGCLEAQSKPFQIKTRSGLCVTVRKAEEWEWESKYRLAIGDCQSGDPSQLFAYWNDPCD